MVYQERPFLERIDRAAELGVDAVEFWEWTNKDLDAVQARIDKHDLDLVGMVGAGTEDPDLTDPNQREQAIATIEDSIATAKEIGRPNLMVLSGQAQADMDRASQHESVVSVLEEVTSTAKAADVTLLLEPLNTAVDHPNHFLETSTEGYEILDEVDSPALELLFDIYHQQVSEGNIIENMTNHIDRIGHVHVADVPGRHEPGDGELHYENILRAIDQAGYEGYVGYEFEPAEDSDDAIRSIWEE
ncbi:hydroxypyruvate isomerase family protein [Haloarchaeobius sp. HRN-SO-5]|uniref:hydroxypyruvate isomerase family protein n=1 Tax=Haloarchaeobius sp. HRN-SO-5 TaxID=3446118 RepID=UPI003EC01D5B